VIGQTLAHYQITDLLGRGGMGEVYRARDSKLDREVAIKILPREMSGDPERVARFQREARTLASLQHENIASIYGFEETSEARFLVMELVAGEDLSERIARGPLPADEATSIALQIARGLEAAHERGLVHRDLKPANVKLTPDGKAKILDFGLARAYAGETTEEEDPSASPTITAAMTQAGTILGTAAYMSPEQARGKSVDKRADIWSLGVILWEMLNGRRMFQGETISDTLAMVMRDEIQLDELPDDPGGNLCFLLERCLERDPAERLRDAGEARWLLTNDTLPGSSVVDHAVPSGSSTNRPWIWLSAALLIVIVLLGFQLSRDSGQGVTGEVPRPTRFALETVGDLAYLDDAPKISPDGSVVVYAAGGELWLHELSELLPQKVLIDAEGARAPFWSPDGTQFG
jgi:serine/threonine-protein kinase